MPYRISDIPVHDASPPATAKMEIENPVGPTSEWVTLSEMLGTMMPTFIDGLNLKNDAGTPNTIIDIMSGAASSDDASPILMPLSAFTKTISGTWTLGSGNAGLDVGAALASTWYHVYEIMRPDTYVVDALISQAPPNISASVTATSASPAVFTWADGTVGLPFQNGCPLVLSGSAAPTGFTLGTTYFVVNSTFSAGTFNLAATQGGTAINSSSTGTSLTATPTVQMPTSYTKKRRIGSFKLDASVHILPFTQTNDTVIMAALTQEFTTTNIGTSAVNHAMSGVPPGVIVRALLSFTDQAASVTHYQLVSPIASTDVAASITAFTWFSGSAIASGVEIAGGEIEVLTDTQGRFRTRQSASGASDVLTCVSKGWFDFRGQ